MKKKIGISIAIVAIIAAIVAVICIVFPKKETVETDAQKFAKEYTSVTEDNVFTYRSAEQIIDILNNGTGVVYLGFPSCPWCQAYVPYLNDVAKDLGLEKVYYFNIQEDRKNNTENYLKMIEPIKDYLQYDEEGQHRIYAPTVIAVNKGQIVGFDDETSWDTKGFEKPSDYWTEAEVNDLKTRLSEMINLAKNEICSDCNK